MTTDDFINWLRGYLDAAPGPLTADQVGAIRARLDGAHPSKPAIPSIPSMPPPYIPLARPDSTGHPPWMIPVIAQSGDPIGTVSSGGTGAALFS